MQRDEKNTDIAVAEDLKPILSVLGEEDSKAVAVLRDELVDNWRKKQIFRTETEMRISVLNDARDIPVLTVPYSVPYESDPSCTKLISVILYDEP